MSGLGPTGGGVLPSLPVTQGPMGFPGLTGPQGPAGSGGGGGGGSGPIASTLYTTGGAGYRTIAANQHGVDLDPVNAIVSVTVPASGNLVVLLSCFYQNTVDNPNVIYSAKIGSTIYAGQWVAVAGSPNYDAQTHTAVVSILGLTPGAVVTVKFGITTYGNGGQCLLDSTVAHPITILVFDAGGVSGGLSTGTAPLQIGANATNAASLVVTMPVPVGSGLASSIFFALCSGVVNPSPTVTSIAQTNVTWTLLHRTANTTNAIVEIWVGKPTGVPGATVTFTLTSASNFAASVSEWPASLALTGVVDRAADNIGTSTFQSTGFIIPTSAKAITFVLFGTNNGSILLTGPTGPYYSLMQASFMAFGYALSGKNPGQSSIPVHANAVWANMILSVI